MLKNGDIQLNWSIKESFFLGVNIIYKSLHILIYFSDSVHRSLFWIFMGSFSIHFYVIFYQLVQPFAFSFTQPSWITQVREQILWKMTVVQCALCAWCLCVFVHCVRGVCACLCMFASGKLWLFSVCEVYPYCFVNIYCYVRFFKISFLVTCLHICEMCLSFSAKFDVRFFLFFVNLYGSVRFTLVFVWTSRNMWCSS